MLDLRKLFNDIYGMIGRYVKNNVGYIRIGVVSEVDPTTHAAKVIFQPSNDTESNWCTVLEAAATKAGTGTSFLPEEGDQVVVHFYGGSKQVPMILGRMFNLEMGIPNGVPGELWLFHKSGSYIKIKNNGKVDVNGNVEIDLTSPKVVITATTGNVEINAASGVVNVDSPTVNMSGNLVVQGTITADGGATTMSGGNFETSGSITATGNVTGSGISLATHVHSGVTTGGDNTGAPV